MTARRWLGLLLLAVTALLSFSLRAADDPPASQGRLSRLFSASPEGLLSVDAIVQDHELLFRRLAQLADKNGDGQLSPEELAGESRGLDEQAPVVRAAPRVEGAGAAEDRFSSQAVRRQAAQVFHLLDVNGDGKVTLEETPEAGREQVSRMLKRADLNNDQAITLEELVQSAERQVGTGTVVPLHAGFQPILMSGTSPLLAVLDLDRDGSLSANEIAHASQSLLRLDRDGDGALSGSELRLSRAIGLSSGAPANTPQVRGTLLERLMTRDTNGDGNLGPGEIPTSMIQRLDVNRDGFVESEELSAAAHRSPGESRGRQAPGDDPRGAAKSPAKAEADKPATPDHRESTEEQEADTTNPPHVEQPPKP